MALTGYPAKKDEQFAENFIEQKKEWFGEGEDRARLETRIENQSGIKGKLHRSRRF